MTNETLWTAIKLVIGMIAIIAAESTIYALIRRIKPDFDEKLWK